MDGSRDITGSAYPIADERHIGAFCMTLRRRLTGQAPNLWNVLGNTRVKDSIQYNELVALQYPR